MSWYTKLPNAIKAAINTGWQTAAGTFLLALLGWLHDVQEWAGSTGTEFPAVTPLGKMVAALFVGVCVGILTGLYRLIRPGPQYPGTPGGVVDADPVNPDVKK